MGGGRRVRAAPEALADEPVQDLRARPELGAGDIERALAAGRLEVHYQPIVALPSRAVLGFEALARLRDPAGRLVPPSEFVEVAESRALVALLGEAVLTRAVAEAARWRAGGSAYCSATVSVNVAPAQLLSPTFPDLVQKVLTEHDVPGSALVLEITERSVTSPTVRPVLDRLCALGVRIALDDFGIGFATLDNLRQLPVQVLKLDRTFVAGVTRPGTDRTIVRAMIDLAAGLGLAVIAEGVETEAQVDALVQLGCPAAQGYLLAPPVSRPQVPPARAPAASEPRTRPNAEVEGWDVAVDEAVLAAVRLLADGQDRVRATVHTVVTAAARGLGLPEPTVRTVGQLGLLHDLDRLTVDGVLPAALAAVPALAQLAAHREDRADVPGTLVRLGVQATATAARLDPDLGPTALAAGLREVAAGAGPGPIGTVLATLAEAPPAVAPLNELVEALDRRRQGRRGLEERLRSLVGLTRVLAGSRDTRDLLRVALDEARRIVGAASASLERWERDTGRLRTLVNVGELGPGEQVFPTDEVYPLAEYSEGRRSLFSGMPYLQTVDDPSARPEQVGLLHRLGKYSSAGVPLYLDGRMWGQVWLTMCYGQPPFGSADIELLTSVASLLGGAVVQAERLDWVSRIAFEDPLTRVGNRRVVDDALTRLSLSGVPTTVALLDVDGLHQLNETAGPLRGDRALIELADALAQQLAGWSGGVLGRLGGDEFCLVLPEAGVADARQLIAPAVQELVGRGAPGVSVGSAVGTAPWTPRDLLATADQDLFRAKLSRVVRD